MDYAANDTLQIGDFFTCTVCFYQLGIVGSIEIAVFFGKGIVQQVQGFPFFPVLGLLFSFFLVQVDITVPYGYVGFGSCFLCRRQLQWMKDSFFVFLIHLLQIADPTVIHHKAIIPVE